MTGSSSIHWTTNSNAPRIAYEVYLEEKCYFAGKLIGAMLYGVVVVLLFQCVGAMLNPANQMKGAFKWGLVIHTVAMFSFLTIAAGISFDTQSTSYVDYRGFPGTRELPPGPVAYQYLVYLRPATVIDNAMVPFNQWLADGLLLYRCWVLYYMDYRAIALPFLMYLTTIATGITFIYGTAVPSWLHPKANIPLTYSSSAVSLNVLLTLMISARLILHSKNIRNAMGASFTAGGMYAALVTMLVESSLPYAVSYILYIALWAARNPAVLIFTPILASTQVIAPFLIILRVANRRALTKDMIASGDIGSLHFETQNGSTGQIPALLDVDQTKTNGEPHDIWIESTTDEVPSCRIGSTETVGYENHLEAYAQ